MKLEDIVFQVGVEIFKALVFHQTDFLLIGTAVHTICTQQYDFNKLAKNILQRRDANLTSNLAIRHGTLNEEMCRRRYVIEQAKSKIFVDEIFYSHLSLDIVCSTTYPCELVIDGTAPYLCCNPNAVVMEKSNNIISYGLLECK